MRCFFADAEPASPPEQGPELYQSAASATAAASLLGFLLAAEAGQLALGGGASLTSLFYASLATVVRAARRSGGVRAFSARVRFLTRAARQASGTLASFALHDDAPPPPPADAPPAAERIRQARARVHTTSPAYTR